MSPPSVDIIIPVYRGLTDTRRCIESALGAQNRVARELIVINDRSPEPEVTEYLRGLKGITLLENETNLGFVRTANRGMGLHPDRDVVLLNADTEVAGDWLDRIVACAARDPRIATVTPFSNNATIASYPRYCEANPLPPGCDTAQLDSLFRAINAGEKPVDLPTGVGFCLFIRRACLREVGLFDAESFGRGYGEENDFCMRALKRGWRNVLCPDVFVRHVGGVSFGESQKKHMTAGAEALNHLHPDYNYRVDEHFRADPERALRLTVDLARLARSPLPRLLFTTHNLGGGTQKHIDDLAHLLEGRAEILLLKPALSSIRTELSWHSPREGLKLFFTLPHEHGELLRILRTIGISRVHFQHLLGIDENLRTLPTDLGVPYDLTFHDFMMICPRIHFMTPVSGGHEVYCGEPDEAGCNTCLAKRPHTGSRDIRAWRDSFGPLVLGAERVFAPSRFVDSRVKRHFPEARTVLAPHLEADPARLNAPVKAPAQPLRVAVFGALDEKKGARLLLDCVELAPDIEFHLHGSFIRKGDRQRAARSRLIDHGPYPSDADLLAALPGQNYSLAWFPSLCPETYSYTLSIALKGGLPILASDLGSFPERLAGRAFSRVLTPGAPPADWIAGMRGLREASASAKSLALTDRNDEKSAMPTDSYEKSYFAAIPASPLNASPLSAAALQPFLKPASSSGQNWLKNLLVSLRYSPRFQPLARLVPASFRRWVRELMT